MKNIALCIFLLLIHHLGYSQTRTTRTVSQLSKTWEIVETSGNKILSVLGDGDTIYNLPSTAIGYPIKSSSVEHFYYWDDNKNRFLFKYGKKYCIGDSNLNIVIGLSDSIIPTILYDSLGPIKLDYHGEDHFSCLFQVINNDKTLLLNNNGDTITQYPYEGLIVFPFAEKSTTLEQKVFIFSTFNQNIGRKFGVLDNNGNILLPPAYDRISLPEFWRYNPYFILERYSDLRSNSTINSIFSFASNTIVFEAENLHCEYLEQEVYSYEKNGLLGLYHPELGILEKPKYVKIYRQRTGIYSMSADLTLLTKRDKFITWVLPDEIWNLYPILERE